MRDELLNYLDEKEYYSNTTRDQDDSSFSFEQDIKDNLEKMIHEYMLKQKQK